MLENVSKFFLHTTTGRIVSLALLVIGVAYAARVYYVDLPAMREKEQRASGIESIEKMADALEAAIAEQGEELAKSLPERTGWYPTDLPCGTSIPFGEQRDPVWDVLGPEVGKQTTFQYRFEFEDGKFRLLSRRDTDCDGFFAVWIVEGRTDWTSVLGRTTEAQNVKE